MKKIKKLTENYKDLLERVLDKQFPKGKCRERGNALVLFAQAVIMFERGLKELKHEMQTL